MKRGFLNDARYKRAIDEAYAPASPPEPAPPRRKKPADDGSREKTDTARDVVGVEPTTEEVYAEGRAVAVWVRPHGSREGEDSGAKTKPPGNTTGCKGEGKQKAVDTDVPMDTSPDGNPNVGHVLPRPPPRRPGWGRSPREDFFHTVPKSHGGMLRKRTIFRAWPRDPNGMAIIPSKKHRGTLSPDGYPWGATLYDFYQVERIPGVPGFMSFMTGSALCEAMKEIGELRTAASEIAWAMSEGKPRIEGAADTAELIRHFDMSVPLIYGLGHDGGGVEAKEKDMQLDSKDGPEQDAEEGDDDLKDQRVSNDAVPTYTPPVPMVPVTSPFHPSHYPEPYPLTPFGTSHSTLLQECIPLYLLPQTLYVHDPFCLLTVRNQEFCDTSWTSRPDMIRTYDLKLSGPMCSQITKARRKAEELEEFKARTLIILRYQRTKEQIKNYEPAIEVPLPPYLRRPTKTEEGHLYLSPASAVGKGHHSVVYKGEWELPRDIFIKPQICPLCFEESAEKEVQRLKDTGRWEKMLKAVAWGPKGFTGRKPTREELEAVCDPINPERDGEIIERQIICVVPPGVTPSQVVERVDAANVWDKLMGERKLKKITLQFISDEDEDVGGDVDGNVAVIRTDPPFSCESQKSCKHEAVILRRPVPRTATFTVVAKLSLEHDQHLAREARNYQKFPEHLFHHYNGYTVVSQLHTIVPVGAVVPQFYGYYTPRAVEEKNLGMPSYLSAILLLEHCGEPIEPERLSLEDQEECASLVLRFQRAGWLHESLAPRNFLFQLGKPTEFPLMRVNKPELSFRLIDFGRSREYEKAAEKRMEEMEALGMFSKLNGKMGVTLF